MISHYENDSASAGWLDACRLMESEGERTPAQPPVRMVRIADTWVTPETAAEFLQECA